MPHAPPPRIFYGAGLEGGDAESQKGEGAVSNRPPAFAMSEVEGDSTDGEPETPARHCAMISYPLLGLDDLPTLWTGEEGVEDREQLIYIGRRGGWVPRPLPGSVEAERLLESLQDLPEGYWYARDVTPDSSRAGSPTLLGDGVKGGGAVFTEDAHGIQCYNHEDLQAPPPTDGDSIHASDGSQAGVEGYPWPDFLPHIRASSRGGTPVRRPPPAGRAL